MGQGITRCHPHMVPLIESLSSDSKDGPVVFRQQLFKMFGHVFSNFGASLYRGVMSTVSTSMRSSSAYKNGSSLVSYHENQLLRLSANLAYSADLALLLGGRLKFEELLLGRLADAMSAIYLGHAVLWHYEKNKGVQGLEAATEHAMLTLEVEAQDALREAAANFPAPLGRAAGFLMSLGCAPLGEMTRPYRPAGDALTKELSGLLTNPSGLRDLFGKNVFVSGEEGDRVSTLMKALPVVIEADQIASAMRKEKRQATVEEQKVLDEAMALRDELVQVDVYDRHGVLELDASYQRPAITQTEEWGESVENKTAALA